LETAETWLTFLSISLHSEVTFLTPCGAPGVLEHPVVLTFLGTISDNEDTVIEGSTAEMLHDTTEIKLEEDGTGINGDGDWSLSDGSLKSRWALWGNVNEGFDLDGTTLSSASAISTLVWVLGLGLDWGSFGIGESVVHKTTIATHVTLSGGAVNELLLGEGSESSGLDLVSTLHGTGGRERPAGTARSLVLNTSDGTLGDPVD